MATKTRERLRKFYSEDENGIVTPDDFDIRIEKDEFRLVAIRQIDGKKVMDCFKIKDAVPSKPYVGMVLHLKMYNQDTRTKPEVGDSVIVLDKNRNPIIRFFLDKNRKIQQESLAA